MVSKSACSYVLCDTFHLYAIHYVYCRSSSVWSLESGDKIMLELFTNIMTNYALYINDFIGLDYVVGFGIVVVALAFVYRLGHTKTF